MLKLEAASRSRNDLPENPGPTVDGCYGCYGLWDVIAKMEDFQAKNRE